MVPDCLIEVAKDHKPKLRVINAGQFSLNLPSKSKIALAEKLEEHEIQAVDLTLNTEPEPNSCDNVKIKCKLDHIPQPQREALQKVIDQYHQVFAIKETNIGQTNVITMQIDTADHPPVKQRPYRTPLSQRPELEKQIDALLKADIIRPSSSAYASPLILVPKKDGSSRLVIDYRKLNETVVKNSYPLPNIEDILSQLGGSNQFSKIDMQKGFHQIPIAEKDKHKTAFLSFSGLYEFQTCPMGLTTAPSCFQAAMDKVLQGLIGQCCDVFVDDVIIYSKSFTDHLRHIKQVFERLQQANMKIKPLKCEFLQSRMLYLGHVITANEIGRASCRERV